MFSFKFTLFMIFCVISIECACRKSFITICETVSDAQYHPQRKTWTELLIQHKNDAYRINSVLTSKQLNSDLSNLKWLIINNQLTQIDRPFTYLKKLQQLILYGNNLIVLQKSTFVGFKKLLKLSLENNNIEEIKSQAFRIVITEDLDLSYNNLQVLVRGTFQKCEVVTLSLTHNKLWMIESQALPRGLKVLHLDHNSFISLPQELNELNQLEELTLSHNKFTNVPDLKLIQSLTKLDLSFNKISSVGQDFDSLDKLRFLDLSGNEIEKFTFTPQFVRNINQNFYLLLAHNRLRNLHLDVVAKKQIILTLSGNPWNCKCMEIMEKIIKNSQNLTTTLCDRQLRGSGFHPYCVADKRRCNEERIGASLMEEFKGNFDVDICDIFQDIDVPVS